MAKKKVQKKNKRSGREGYVTVEVPIPKVARPVYISERVDMRLEQAEAECVRGLFDQLRIADARLPGGRELQRPVDVIRWLLAEIGLADPGVAQVDQAGTTPQATP